MPPIHKNIVRRLAALVENSQWWKQKLEQRPRWNLAFHFLAGLVFGYPLCCVIEFVIRHQLGQAVAAEVGCAKYVPPHHPMYVHCFYHRWVKHRGLEPYAVFEKSYEWIHTPKGRELQPVLTCTIPEFKGVTIRPGREL